MPKDIDLSFMKAAFRDNRVLLAFALVKKATVLSDFSAVVVDCEILGKNDARDDTPLQARAHLTSVASGPSAGLWDIPISGDLVILAMPDGESEHAHIIARCSSAEDKIPEEATAGNTVLRAKLGKELIFALDGQGLAGTSKIKLGGAGSAEPVPLGTQLKAYLDGLHTQTDAAITAIKTGPIGIGNLGAPVPTYPALIASLTAIQLALLALKVQYLDTPTTDILSQHVTTER